ncbi:MAG: tail fiber protein [Betaproteobacteria bacterium]|nr:tail fiber protein [Betaproteobacteria bacterium]
MDPFIGQISAFGFSFNPRDWAYCNGALVPISQNNALFSLLGTFFGGDARVTFGLPDLRGRHPIGQGAGPGLTPYSMGEMAGRESQILQTSQVPLQTHTHAAQFTPTGGGITVTASLPLSTDAPSTATPTLANGDTAYLANASAGLNLKGLYTKTKPAAGATATLPADVTVSGGGGGTVAVDPAGNPAANPIDMRSPFLAINFCIALLGNFPSRN